MDEPERERRRLEATIARLQRAAEASTGAAEGARWKTGALAAASVAAFLCVLLVLRRGPPFLLLLAMLFVFFAAGLWWLAGQRRAEPSTEARDEELLRTEAAIREILEALQRAPRAVRGFVRDAEQALEAISRGARALARRSASLRALEEGLSGERVESDHAELLSRRTATADPDARRILEQALAVSELKRHRVRELGAYAERLSAERLRIRHAVEGLRLDIERALAADLTQSAEDAARSLGRLTDEIGAIADALESVSALH